MKIEKVEMPSSYSKLAAINVNDHVEKKNGLSYLSWAWAWDQLMRQDPCASVEYHDPIQFGETMMVSCTVTAFGISRRMHLPVMDHRNRAIANPDAFAVNTAMQRCLVKAIALHGLGLYIYAGEDLPADEQQAAQTQIQDEEAKLLAQYMEAAEQGTSALKAFHSMVKGPHKVKVWNTHSETLKEAAAVADQVQ